MVSSVVSECNSHRHYFVVWFDSENVGRLFAGLTVMHTALISSTSTLQTARWPTFGRVSSLSDT